MAVGSNKPQRRPQSSTKADAAPKHSSDARSSSSSDDHDAYRPAGATTTTDVEGVLFDGTRFRMPPTISVMRSLITPRCYRLLSTQIWVLLCLLTNPISLWVYYTYGPTDRVMVFYTAQFVFWRLMYNVGIGLILHVQSNGKRFEAWVARHVLRSRMGRWLLERSVAFRDPNEKPFKVSEYPPSFSAWMVFRFIVNVILACDLLAYFVLVWVHWTPPQFFHPDTGAVNLVDVVLYLVGTGLVIFAIWSKSDAHRVIGDYAWYWGDFFFLLEQKLTFDGIFEMFPHPMYTVGYAFMYGFALMAKSHAVFYWSVFGHVSQIVFLALVENPHIDRTYNTAYVPSEEEARREALLYDEDNGYFERKELVVLHNFRLFRATDIVTVLCLSYSVAVWLLARGVGSFVDIPEAAGPSSPDDATQPWPLRVAPIIADELQRPGSWAAILQYAFWRLLLLGGLGWALHQQSLYKRWSNEFGNARRAFDSWKVLYNTVVTVANFTFILCALQLGEWSSLLITPPTLIEEWRFTTAIIGALLIGVNAWSSIAVYEAIGDFGFFYGDFFIEDVPSRLAYSGVYRYLNNPDTVLGCAWFYGLALLSGSPAVAMLAIISHACVKLFEVLVESPHMRRKYGSMMRKEGGTRRALKERTKSVKSALDERRRRARLDYERAIERLKQEVEKRKAAYEALSTRLHLGPRQRATEGPQPQVKGRRQLSPPTDPSSTQPPSTMVDNNR